MESKQQITGEIKKEIEKMTIKHHNPKLMAFIKSSVKSEVHSNTT